MTTPQDLADKAAFNRWVVTIMSAYHRSRKRVMLDRGLSQAEVFRYLTPLSTYLCQHVPHHMRKIAPNYNIIGRVTSIGSTSHGHGYYTLGATVEGLEKTTILLDYLEKTWKATE